MWRNAAPEKIVINDREDALSLSFSLSQAGKDSVPKKGVWGKVKLSKALMPTLLGIHHVLKRTTRRFSAL